MKQLIDKSALVAEIERRIKELQDLFKEDEKKLDSFQKTAIHLCTDECKVVLNILDTIEVKEVEENAFIEKACEWLSQTDFCHYYNKEFIDAFRKAMEE